MAVEGAERRRFVAELVRQAEGPWRTWIGQQLEPAQWIHYSREYYTSADQRVRITLDLDLRFFDQRLRARLSSAHRTPAPRLLVLEVKCAPEDLARARDIVGRLPLPLGRCSKYVLAGDPGGGPLPSLLAV